MIMLQDQRLHHDQNLVGSSSYIHRNHKTSPSNDEPEQQAIESVAAGACIPSSDIPHLVVVVPSKKLSRMPYRARLLLGGDNDLLP